MVPLKNRPEIDGLRALAVFLVVFAHLGLGWFAGGFIGVDVFFVISGYLITSLIATEYASHLGDANGAWFSLRAFYFRRIKRILPMSLVVLLTTIVVAALAFNSVRAQQILADGIWSAIFLANVHFIAQSTDYFQQQLSASPFQHYWSLAVEEQFYVVFPALFLLATWVVRKSPKPNTWISWALALIAAITVSSLGWSVWQTGFKPAVAYFSSLTRAYELGVGALLAIALTRRQVRLGRVSQNLLGLSGLLMIVVSGVAMPTDTGFPGALALVPTLGAALFILANSYGIQHSLSGKLLAWPPVVFLGKISFSIYLWHWPIIVLWPSFDLAFCKTVWFAPAVILATVASSTISYYAIEQPFRRLRAPASFKLRMPRRPSAWIAQATVVLLAVTLVAGGTQAAVKIDASNKRLNFQQGSHMISVIPDQSAEPSATVSPSQTASDSPTTTPSSKPSPTASASESESSRPTASASPSQTPTKSYSQLLADWKQDVFAGVLLARVPDDLNPSVTQLLSERGKQWAQCMDPAKHQITCQYGASSAKHTAVILGDSYALAIYPMVINALGLENWRVIALNRRECMVADVLPWSWNDPGEPMPDCVDHRTWSFDYLRQLKPDLLVLSDQPFHPITDGSNKAGESHDALWVTGLDRSLSTLSKLTSELVYFGLPSTAAGLTDCVDGGGNLGQNCFGNSNQYRSFVSKQESITKKYGGTFIDSTDWLCDGGSCPPIIDSTPVYWDGAHFTQTFAAKIAPLFRAFLLGKNLL
jgi:peptidoglycan/LPS O-acetylase OafA/YrhL